MIALPFTLPSLGPVALFYLTGRVNISLEYLGPLNGLGSCFDMVVIATVLLQLPSNAVLRNKGWVTYWQPQHAS